MIVHGTWSSRTVMILDTLLPLTNQSSLGYILTSKTQMPKCQGLILQLRHTAVQPVENEGQNVQLVLH